MILLYKLLSKTAVLYVGQIYCQDRTTKDANIIQDIKHFKSNARQWEKWSEVLNIFLKSHFNQTLQQLISLILILSPERKLRINQWNNLQVAVVLTGEHCQTIYAGPDIVTEIIMNHTKASGPKVTETKRGPIHPGKGRKKMMGRYWTVFRHNQIFCGAHEEAEKSSQKPKHLIV